MSRNNHLMLMPVYNLKVSDDIKKEMRVGDVTLIDRKKLLRNIKRYGFPWTLTKLKGLVKNKPQAKTKVEAVQNLFQDKDGSAPETCALVKISSREDEDIQYGLNKIEEAIWTVGSFQLGFRQRGKIIRFGFPETCGVVLSQIFFVPTSTNDFLHHQSIKRISSIRSYDLGEEWKKHKKRRYWATYLDILNGEINLDDKWKKVLSRAVILAGKSAFEMDVALAFLYNMVAIETLLKKADEAYEKVVPRRLTDLFGWINEDENETYEIFSNNIKRLYVCRNKFVHDGYTQGITISDLINSDTILFNLLNNLCLLYKFFDSKEKLIQFSEKTAARRVLNMKIIRPNTLQFAQLRYTRRDLSKISMRKL